MEHWRYYIHGRLLEAFNRRKAAIAAYLAALRLNPDFHRAANRVAYLLASLERYAEAQPYFDAVLRADPGSSSPSLRRGCAPSRAAAWRAAWRSLAMERSPTTRSAASRA